MSSTDFDSDTDDGTAPNSRSTDQRPADDDGDDRGVDTSRTDAEANADRADLAAKIDLLEEENRRLRREYARVRRAQYRKRAIGLAVIGLVAIGGGLVFPDVRDLLFALGSVGLFGAVLTVTLSPGTVVAAEIGERIYASLAANQAAIAGALGLTDDRLYVPSSESRSESGSKTTSGPPECRLFVPRYLEYDLPDDGDGPIATESAARGLVLEPTGARLFDEFERALTADLATTPTALSAQLADALVEQFEFARSVDPHADPTRVTFAVTDSAFGDVDRFDHPIASFLAVGLAIGLDYPIALEVTDGGERADWLVTCRWDLDVDGEPTEETTALVDS